MSKNHIVLPLKLWKIIFSIVVLIVVLLLQEWDMKNNINRRNETLNLARLQQKNNKYHVVAIGTSLLRYGIPFDDILEKELIERKIDISMNRFTLSGANSGYFVNALPAMTRLNPNLIIIQSELFTLNFGEEYNFRKNIDNFYKNIDKFYTSISSKSNVLGHDGDYNANRSEDDNDTFRSNCINSFLDRSKFDAKTKAVYKNVSIGIDRKLDPYRSFFQQARARGIKVIFLEIGRSKAANDYLGKNFQDKMDKSLQNLSSETGLKIWRFPANLPLKDYCDLAHLNDGGRKIFTEWFIQQLKTEL
jgi:hypothetical protein